MTPDIIIVLSILLGAVVFFVTGLIRMDLTALLVLLALAFTGLVDTTQSLAGFGNPAVITVLAMYILSAGLTRTGISSVIGAQLLKLARKSERRLMALLMTITAVLSTFMNITGIATMFLPITLELSRRTGQPASRLLLPMSYGCLLGGFLLLIGTTSNLVVRDVMRQAGYTPLGMFDFTPGGLVILLLSVLYMVFIGRRFMPVRQTPQALSADDMAEAASLHYGLEERLAMLVVPADSPLAGKTLIESRIGRALDLNILSIQRDDGTSLPAEPHALIEGGDRLLVLGRLERIDEISRNPMFSIESEMTALERLQTCSSGLAEFEITPDSPFADKTLAAAELRQDYNVNVLAVRRGEALYRSNLQDIRLHPGDILLIHAPDEKLELLKSQPGYQWISTRDISNYGLDDRLLCISIPQESSLINRTLTETRLGAAFGLTVLRIKPADADWTQPHPTTQLRAGDVLVVSGRPLDIEVLRGMQSLTVERTMQSNLQELTSGPVQIVEVMLSPYTTLAGENLRTLNFREKYGVSVLAVWRGQRAHRSGLAEIPLQYGDALLCYGPQEKLKSMARERDFVVLKMDLQETPRLKKAPLAAAIMLGVVAAAIALNVPISIAALAGCVLMALCGILSMDEAYQSIEWRPIFIIAAMLPLGTAMQQTGTTDLIGNFVVQSLGPYGESGIFLGLMLFTLLITQIIPSAAVAVIMTPIALNTAQNLSIAPQAYVMGIAYVLAACFTSPVAHPANLLVMSPGGYRFMDYVKHGLPFALIVLAVSAFLLPVIFPYR
jgi:di/tricarboxylate transporter